MGPAGDSCQLHGILCPAVACSDDHAQQSRQATPLCLEAAEGLPASCTVGYLLLWPAASIMHICHSKPLSLSMWAAEELPASCKVHCVLLWPAALTVHIYHGRDRVKEAEQLARYACVLTTYTTLGMDAPLQPEKQAMAERQPNALAPGGGHQSNQTCRVLSPKEASCRPATCAHGPGSLCGCKEALLVGCPHHCPGVM